MKIVSTFVLLPCPFTLSSEPPLTTPKSQSLAGAPLKWGRVEVCRHLLHAHLATHCPRRRGSPGIIRVGWVLRLFSFGGGAQGLCSPQPEPEMWAFNYTIKCTIRHNYQCLSLRLLIIGV